MKEVQQKLDMNTKESFLFLWICNLFTLSYQSVAGVTYRDHFDFEERYSHDECNPLYWHPLHMPDHCTKMYENLIRNRLHNSYFYQSKSDQDEKRLKHFKRLTKTSSRRKSTKCNDKSDENTTVEDYSPSSIEYDNPSGSEAEDTESPEILYKYIKEVDQNPQPYQEMLNMMKEDVNALPAMPVIGMLPNLGLATIYRQPVSKKTENMIKKMATSYGSAARDTYMDVASQFYPSYSEFKTSNKDSTVDEFSKNNKNNTKTIEVNKNNHSKLKTEIKQTLEPYNKNKGGVKDKLMEEKNKVQTKKIVQGNMEAYIQLQRYQG